MLDSRLGRKAEDGSVDKWPEQYPDGTAWSHEANPAPTTLMIDSRHFVILPLSVGNITDDIRQTLLDTVTNKSGKSVSKVTVVEENEG